MTSFLDTEYIIVVSVGRTATVHRLVPVPEWRPQLIDIADRDLVGFPDDLTGAVVTIDVLSEDGSLVGYLIPTSGRCALCHNQRHITVRHWAEHASDSEDADTLSLYEPDTDSYTVYTRKPCPACRYVDYELSHNDGRDREDQQ